MLRRTAAFAFAALLAGPLALAEPPAPAGLLGLWEVLEVRNLATGQVEPKRREFHAFTPTHETIVLAGENRPKIAKSLADMTAEELLSQQPIGAGFYEYRVEGDTIVRTALLTLSAFYEGRTVRTKFRLEGDSLTTEDNHPADGQLRRWTMRRVE